MPDMVEINARKLSGRALDWAVAKVEGEQYSRIEHFAGDVNAIYEELYEASSDWSITGPLRDKYKVAVYDVPTGVAATLRAHPEFWIDESDSDAGAVGDTALVAICRAIVISILGETLLVPAGLLNS